MPLLPSPESKLSARFPQLVSALLIREHLISVTFDLARWVFFRLLLHNICEESSQTFCPVTWFIQKTTLTTLTAEPVDCDTCLSRFFNFQDLVRHVRATEAASSTPAGLRQLRRRHWGMSTSAGAEQVQQPHEESALPQSVLASRVRKPCPQCQRQVVYLRRHLRQHQAVSDCICDLCLLRLSCKRLLINHERLFHRPSLPGSLSQSRTLPLSCDLCSLVLPRGSFLTTSAPDTALSS